MARTTFARIPQELVDAIGDSVYNSGGSPAELSLVCRSLRESSQKYLFKSVRLLPRGRFFHLRNIIHANPRLATYIHHIHTTSNQLIEYRGNDIPVTTLLGFIRVHVPYRALTLSLYRNPIDEHEYPTMPTRYITLLEMKACLSHVTELYVDNVKDLPCSVLFNLQRGVIKRLVLQDVSFVPVLLRDVKPLVLYSVFGEVFQSTVYLKLVGIDFIPGNLIYGCVHLQSLVLEGASGVFTSMPKKRPYPRPKLEFLVVSKCDFVPVRDLVDRLVDISCLKCFYDGEDAEPVEEIEEGDDNCLPYILDACKSSLQHLRIRGGGLNCFTVYSNLTNLT